MNYRTRRIFATTLTLLAVGLTALTLEWTRMRMGDESTLSGWTLIASTAGLYLLSARKQLVGPRWGPVAMWMQMHVYMGSFASIVFLMHIGWPIRGVFESALAAVFVFVAVTGMLLGRLSRTMPKRLAAIPKDHPLERVPALQLTVAREAHQVAMASAEHGEGATLAEYYQRRLLPYFQTPRRWVYLIVPNGLRRRSLLRELNDLDRYLAEHGIQSRQSLSAMVQAKDDLDFQHALQTRLRTMFMLHVSLTWALALMIAVHVVLVYRFQGAML